MIWVQELDAPLKSLLLIMPLHMVGDIGQNGIWGPFQLKPFYGLQGMGQNALQRDLYVLEHWTINSNLTT